MTILRATVFASLLLSSVAFCQQASGPLTDERIMTLAQAGVSHDELARIIATAPAVSFDLRPVMTDAMMKAGVTEDMIKTMAARESGVSAGPFSERQSQSNMPAGGPNLGTLPTDIGVYTKGLVGQWIDIEPEIVNWKSGGVLKTVFTDLIVKPDINAHIKGGQSKAQLISNELLVIAPEGVSVTEYQLLKMREHSGSREFRAATGGVFHQSGGSDRDVVDFQHSKIGSRTFLVTLSPSLREGEYGLLPPGAVVSRGATSLGKLYSFRIAR